jgi:hypothetical protein
VTELDSLLAKPLVVFTATPVCTAGSLVSGVVVLDVSEPLVAESVSVRLKGVARSKFQVTRVVGGVGDRRMGTGPVGACCYQPPLMC